MSNTLTTFDEAAEIDAQIATLMARKKNINQLIVCTSVPFIPYLEFYHI